MIGKPSQNSPILELIFWGSVQCAFLYALLTVDSHYSGVSSIQFFFGFLDFFNFAKPFIQFTATYARIPDANISVVGRGE